MRKQSTRGLIMRCIRLLASVAVITLAVSACSLSTGAESQTQSSSSALTSPEAPGSNVMTEDDAREEFLAVVCPTDTALQFLANVPLEEGGWDDVTPSIVRPYVEAAVAAASRTATDLSDVASWPDSVAREIPSVSKEYLAILAPLERINQATKDNAMKAAWDEIQSLPRTAEQQVRLTLGLGVVWSDDDGCPPPPKVKPKQAQKEDGNSATSNSSWTTLWQSPSGNLRCGFAPSGSLGVPVAACLDSDTNTLARLPKGYYPLFTQATSSQRAQVPGGQILEFYESISGYGFTCSLEDSGMTCIDTSTGAGFVIRRGAAFPL
jgi:hypothetical protein